jgi:hypothetical protein
MSDNRKVVPVHETPLQQVATLENLLRRSRDLQSLSARMAGESKTLEARCAAVTAHAKRLWDQRQD